MPRGRGGGEPVQADSGRHQAARRRHRCEPPMTAPIAHAGRCPSGQVPCCSRRRRRGGESGFPPEGSVVGDETRASLFCRVHGRERVFELWEV